MDLLEAVGISTLPLGVVNTTGLCDQRAITIENGLPVYGQPDRAYKLTQRAVLTVSTAQVFPGIKAAQQGSFFVTFFSSFRRRRGVSR